jgi:hypothetical protein
MVKFVRERQRDLAVAEAKELPIFALPELVFNLSSNQDPQVYGSLGHDALLATSVGLYAFVFNDHVHELRVIVEGLYVPVHDEDISMTSIEEELDQVHRGGLG